MKRLQPLAPLNLPSRPGTAPLPPLTDTFGRSSFRSPPSASISSSPITPALQPSTTLRSARTAAPGDAAAALPSFLPPSPRRLKVEINEEKEPSPFPRSSSSSSSAVSPALPSPSSGRSQALAPLSPSGKSRGLPPLIPASSASQTTATLTSTELPADDSKATRKRAKQKASAKERHRGGSDALLSPARREKAREESKEREEEPVESKEREPEPSTPSFAPSFASSVDTSDSDDDDGSPSLAAPLTSAYAATAPASSLPVITGSTDDAFAATQPLDSPAIPPPAFPAPLSYSPPTVPSSLSLSVFVGTWNLHGKPPPPSSSLSLFLPPLQHDVYVIGTEECDMSIERAVLLSPVNNGRKPHWVRRVWEAIGGESEYSQVAEEGMVAMHLVVFVRRHLAPHLSAVDTARVATGVGNVLGNKGGVAVTLTLGSTSLLFVCSHLAAHQHAVAQRNADFHKINAKLPFKGRPSVALAPLACDRFERVFWLGDLNYRIEGTYTLVTHLIREGLLEPLLHNDQLTQERAAGRVFAGFHERPITFKPTYKVDVGSAPTRYDSSKKRRVPGWTDRVLWKDVEGGGGVECLHYDSVEGVNTSDHFPVRAVFNVRVDGVQEAKPQDAQQGQADGAKPQKAKERQASKTESSRSLRQAKGKGRAESSTDLQLSPAPSIDRVASASLSASLGERAESGGGLDEGLPGRRRGSSGLELTLGEDEGHNAPRMDPGAILSTAEETTAQLPTEQESRVCAIQ